MVRDSVRRFVRVGVAAAVVTTGVVWESHTVQAAAFPDTNPTRLYMAPDGTTLFASLLGVPIGTLELGPGPDDIISGDTRDITVAVDPGPDGCNTIDDQPVGVEDYDLDDCPRLQLDVTRGRLKLAGAELLYRDHTSGDDIGEDNVTDPVWRLPGGAIVSQIGGGGDPTTPNDPEGHTGYHLSGLADQINAALDDMSYVPDAGYRYVGNNGETLSMLLASGDPNVSAANHDVEIRVLDVNDAATLDGPGYRSAEPEVELLMPPVAPPASWPYAGTLWTVSDEDNDEAIDDDDGETLPDGAGDKMLLVGYLDCGVPTVDLQTGFHFRGGLFETDDTDIEDFLTEYFGLATAPQEVQDAVGLLFDALNVIEPGLTTLPLATSDPFGYNDLFAGIADIDEVAYALSQVSFLSDAQSDACTLYTVVSDLGNNGLPLQYIGDPPTGVEVPFLGIPPIDIVETQIEVGDLQTIEVNFDPATQTAVEGTTATATIAIDPPIHPAFDLRWSTVAGTATAGTDFEEAADVMISVPENAATVQVGTDVLGDVDPEADETFLFDLTVPTDPPGSPSGFFRPFGYEIVSTQSVQTVTIIDDDGSTATEIVSFEGESVVEGDGGATTMTFTIGLDGPAAGTETVDVAVSLAGTASNPADFGDPVPASVSFAPGAMSATLDVPIVGDLDDEDDETVVLQLENPSGLAIDPLALTATGTIVDDDALRVASIADAEVIEGDSGTTDLVFTISLDQPAKGTEALDVTTADGTATVLDADYAALTDEPVGFAAGASSAQVVVVVNGDTDVEPDETLVVSLGSASGVAIGSGMATGTIRNDDGVIGVSVDDVTVTEGNAGTTNATFTVTLAEPALGGESIRIATSDGSATIADGDYVAGTDDITFALGQTTATFTVLVNGDTDDESDESFTVGLSLPVGLVIVDGEGLGTILTDDAAPPDPAVISIADAFVSEGGAANETTITMTNPGAFSCSVTLTSANFTAIAPGDYAALAVEVIIPPNSDTIVVPLDIVDDDESEVTELFFLTIALGAGSDPRCEIGDDTATIYIEENTPPSVTIDQATGQSDPTVSSPILFTVEFTEAVTGFDAGDVSFTGSTTDAVLTPTVTGGPQTYTVSVAAVGATATGTVVASIPAGAASDGSSPSASSTSTDNSVTLVVDTEPPTVTVNQAIGQADPTDAAPVVFTVVFSEPVTGFETGDVTLGGTAGATTAVVTDSGDGSTFSVAVSGMTQDGTVIASVGAGVAADAAANPNVVSTSTDNVVTYDFDEGDVTAPSVTVNQAAGQADPTSVSPIAFTVVFSEPVTGFTTADVMLGGTAGVTTATISGPGPTYTVVVSGMSGPGTVIVSLPAGGAVDAALNPSTASTSTDNTVTYEPDVDAPLAIDVPDDIVTGNDPGEAGAVVEFAPAAASGGTPPVTVTCDRTSGQFFALGTTTVTCTASDGAGAAPSERFVEATVTATFTITVLDTEPPVIADPPDLVRGATSATGLAVTFATPAASDNAGPPTVTCSPASGSVFAVGATTVTCTATDAAGNSASATFSVTVTAPASGGLPITGSGSHAAPLLAAMLLAAGLATRRIGRRPGVEVS